jgi:predicted nucleic acid-binding protein
MKPMPGKVAFDTNILIYSIGGRHSETKGSPQAQALAKKENQKAAIAKSIVAEPSIISVQVFNEFANVARRKLGLMADDIHGILEDVARVHTVVALTWETTRLALEVSKIGEARNPDGSVRPGNYSTYDSLIVAAALLAGCDTLYTEDTHAGAIVGGRLKIIDPFAHL